MSFVDDDEPVNHRPFAVRLEGTDKFLKVHRGRNGLPSGMLTWELEHNATWFETRDEATRHQRKLIGEKAVIHDGRTFR